MKAKWEKRGSNSLALIVYDIIHYYDAVPLSLLPFVFGLTVHTPSHLCLDSYSSFPIGRHWQDQLYEQGSKDKVISLRKIKNVMVAYRGQILPPFQLHSTLNSKSVLVYEYAK